jgi:hypothetical protein
VVNSNHILGHCLLLVWSSGGPVWPVFTITMNGGSEILQVVPALSGEAASS